MIRILTDATLNRLHQELAAAQEHAEHEAADASIIREDLFATIDELATARENAGFYSELAERWHERLLARNERADAEFESMLAVIKQVTRVRDEARRQAASFEKEAEEYHRALVAEQRRSDEAGQMRAERDVLAQAARAVGLTILLRYGRYHSVHPDVEAAKRSAEQHGASRYGWTSGSTSQGTPDWTVVQYKPQAPVVPTRQAEETKEVTS